MDNPRQLPSQSENALVRPAEVMYHAQDSRELATHIDDFVSTGRNGATTDGDITLIATGTGGRNGAAIAGCERRRSRLTVIEVATGRRTAKATAGAARRVGKG